MKKRLIAVLLVAAMSCSLLMTVAQTKRLWMLSRQTTIRKKL